MNRVLVVHHDRDIADDQAETLRRAGYVVQECAGPTCGPCPVIRGDTCPAVEDADVLVYDVWATGDSGVEQTLIHHLREQHPETPLVLVAPGAEFDWVETEGSYGVVPLVGIPSGPPLLAAVGSALQAVDRTAWSNAAV
jgi:DNA-binding NtrC family response regulator